MYNEIIEMINLKAKEVENMIFDLKEIERNLQQDGLKAKEIFEKMQKAEEIEKEIVYCYKKAIGYTKEDSNYHYCETIEQCVNNIELIKGIQEKLRQFTKEVEEAREIIDRIKNKTF